MINTQIAQIIGIGTDLVDIRRIDTLIARHGAHFLLRVFTEQERSYAQRHRSPGTIYAKRFAAKEAFSKAVGCGIGKIVSFQDIEVARHTNGQPFISFSVQSYERVTEFLGGPFTSFLSLTDEYPFAQAFVIVSQK